MSNSRAITYIYFKKINNKKLQEEIGRHYNCSSVCIRSTYKELIKNDNDIIKFWSKKNDTNKRRKI